MCSTPSVARRLCRCASLLPRLLLLLVLAIALLALCPPHQGEAAAVPVTTSSSSAAAAALCPSSPICSRAGAPGQLRRRYCNGLLSQLLSFFSAGRAAVSRSRKASKHELPFFLDAELKSHVLQEMEQLLAANLVGQDHILSPLLEALRRKMHYPGEPLVLHLAGDNGVGKTFTARLLSLALSLRCAPGRDLCDAGDNLLSLSGTSFDGLSVADARSVIVGRVLQHMERYPHGVVLIDDFTAMDPALVPVLAPLLGRASHYPEQFLEQKVPDDDDNSGGGGGGGDIRTASPSSGSQHPATSAAGRNSRFAPSNAAASSPPPSLGQLLVIITTDLGQQGRTMGRSASQIEQLVRDSFVELYGSLLPSYTRTFAYLPFTMDVAAAVVRSAVTNLPCSIGIYAASGTATAAAGPGTVTAASIDEMAVLFLVEKHRGAWEGKENGHALRRVVEDELVAQVLALQEERGLDTRLIVRFILDVEKMAVVLDTKRRDGQFSADEEDVEEAERREKGSPSHDL